MSPLVSGQIYALLNTEFTTTEVVEYLATVHKLHMYIGHGLGKTGTKWWLSYFCDIY